MKLTIFDIENWKEIGSTLLRNKTRTFLTGFGIFWGVAMLAMLTGGARGGEDMLKRNFDGFATNTGGFVAATTTMPYKGHQKGRYWTMDVTDVSLLKEAFPEMEAIVPVFQNGNKSVKYGKYSFSASMMGTEPDYTKILQPLLFEGRFINEADEAGERKVAVIGKKVATQLFPSGEDPLGKNADINGSTYSVVGVMGDASEMKINGSLDESVIIPSSTFRRTNGYGDKIDFMMVTGKPTTDMADVMPKMRSVIYRRHDIHPDDTGAMWSINIADEFKKIDTVFTGIDLVAWFIGVSTLLAGIIGIGNIMWVIVKERTQEIGIRRAIGAKPRDIIVQVLSEGMALTLIFGLGGICFAALVLGILQHLNNSPDEMTEARFQMAFTTALGILGLFVLLGTLAGLIPSIKAMKIKPVEAINER